MRDVILHKFILDGLIDKIPYAIFWKDTQSVFLGCNQQFAKQFGFNDPKEIIGKTDHDLPFQPHLQEKYRHDDAEVLKGIAKLNYEEEQTQPDGTTKTVLVSKTPLYGKSKTVIGILGIYTDITERKKRERELLEAKENAEIASKTKTEFLENMRHDIRTPLTGIVGFAELIKSEVTDPKIKEYAGNLVASGYALADLLNGVLEVVKVNSGEVPILKKKFSLQKKLNEVILLNQAIALHKKIDLSLDYDSAIPNYLVGDSARIHRVILELVTNALNFTHKGYVKLSAQLARNNDDDVVIKIIVDDTGIGIPTEKQQDIYLQFKRLTPSYEGIYKGQGLGLYVAKKLIDDMNGEIYVESQLGAGSKFIFIVKLKKALLDEEFGSENLIPSFTGNKFIPPQEVKFEPVAVETTDAYKSHILVVEDSPLAAQVVIDTLSHMDCTVDLVKNGREAVERAEHTPYDLIFMDIGLPGGIDGYEATKRIRLNELNRNHVPIIALTAHAGEENKKDCIDIGMNAVLIKPLTPDKAADILNSFIPYRREKLNLKEIPDSIEETPPLQELAIFDFEELKTLSSNNEKAAIGMAKLFLAELPKDLQEIQTAYAPKDWSTVQQLTHKFKGGVSYIGAPRLKEACRQLESTIKNGEAGAERYENLYDQFLKVVALTEKTIRTELHL